MKKIMKKALWSAIGFGLVAMGLTMGVAPSQARPLTTDAPVASAPTR